LEARPLSVIGLSVLLVVGVVVAAGRGDSAVALGNATGSNLVNLGVILGTVVLVLTVGAARDEVRRDLVAALGVLVVVAALSADGVLGRVDAVVLFAGFGVWIAATIRSLRNRRADGPRPLADDGGAGPRVGARTIVALGAGLALLALGAQAVVHGAAGIGEWLGWDEFVIGVVIVAVATSTPELATAVVAVRRGHADLGVGAMVGSNVFNMSVVVGSAGLLAPMVVPVRSTVLALAFAAMATVLAWPTRSERIPRWRGAALLAVYAAHLALVLVTR